MGLKGKINYSQVIILFNMYIIEATKFSPKWGASRHLYYHV